MMPCMTYFFLKLRSRIRLDSKETQQFQENEMMPYLIVYIYEWNKYMRLKLYKHHPNKRNIISYLIVADITTFELGLRSSLNLSPKDSNMSWKQVMIGIWLGLGVTVASESRSHLDSNSVSGKTIPSGLTIWVPEKKNASFM